MSNKRKHDATVTGGDSETNTVFGYIHNSSESLTSKSGNTRYFDGYLQTETDILRFVSFSVEKHNSFQSAQNMKSPVKLSNVVIRPVAGKKEVTVNNNSRVEVCRRLDFERKSELPGNKAPLLQLEAVNNANMMCSISIKFLGFIDDEQTVQTRYGAKQVRTAAVADQTGNMKMPLWGTNIKKVNKDAFYNITNIISSTYKGQLQLNTTKDSKFTEISEYTDTKEDICQLVQNTKEFVGKMQSCRVSSYVKCLNCQVRCDYHSETTVLKCDVCKMKQKLADMPKIRNINMQIINADSEVKKFVIFNDAVATYINENGLANKTNDELEDHFLMKETIKIKHVENCDVGNSIN